jgi:hypothetical protein
VLAEFGSAILSERKVGTGVKCYGTVGERGHNAIEE